jgi:hypothetical protein
MLMEQSRMAAFTVKSIAITLVSREAREAK